VNETSQASGVAAQSDTPEQEELNERQRRILNVIRQALDTQGYPPSVREIGETVGLKSPSSVHTQLAALERAGYLKRRPTRSRAIELLDRGRTATQSVRPVQPAAAPDADATTPVPLVGEIAAGAPVVAEENVEEVLALPKALVGEGSLFMLRVRGASMIEAGVHDGDLVVVRQQPTVEQGEMCAVVIEGEATVKFFRRSPEGRIYLDPANPAYEPILVGEYEASGILGRVVIVLRRV
jgi:repressor LexA